MPQFNLAEAKARHENMLTGKRPEEQDVIRAQRREIEGAVAGAGALPVDDAADTAAMPKNVARVEVPVSEDVP